LEYTGSSGTPQSTDRQLRMYIGATAGTIDASGAGPNDTISFTYAGPPTNFWDTGGARTLTLTGTNTGNNSFAHNIKSHTLHTTLAKTGVGTWDVTSPHNADALSIANAAYGGYGGGTTISGGTLGFVAGGLGGGIIDVTGDATLRWDAGNSMDISSGTGGDVARSLQIESGVTATLDLGTNNVTLAGPIGTGSGALTKAGTGTLVVSAANTYAGDTTISTGTLQLGDGVANDGSVAGNIVNNGSLMFAKVSNQSYSGNISGSGSVKVLGAGTTLELSGNNSYTGGTLVGAGLLKAVSDGSLGNGDVLVGKNAAIEFETTPGTAHMSTAGSLLLEARTNCAVTVYFTGTETIHAISFDGGISCGPPGTYGEVGSGADHESDLFCPGFGGVFQTTALPSASVLSASAITAPYGSSITFTSTVTGSGATPTGTVTFYDGGSIYDDPSLGSAALDGSGKATLTVNNLQVQGSPHSITAHYFGDSTYGCSTSTNAVLVTITPISSTNVLVSSLNPSAETSNVTFTATLTAAVGTPAGDVVFKGNGTAFATVALNGSGQAQASTDSLPIGTNTITAEYAAQGNYLASTGTVLQVVTPNTICSLTNSIVSITNNGNGSFTLTCQGTPLAQYYVVASPDVTAAMTNWTPVPDSTNTAPDPGGQWSVIVSNPAPQYYRSIALNPCSP
jgi:fibronectin-binding autotransporter adhesin